MRIVSDLNKYQRSSKNDRRTSCIRWKEGSDHFQPAGRNLISESKAVWSFQWKKKERGSSGADESVWWTYGGRTGKRDRTGIYWDQSPWKKAEKETGF